MSQLSSNLKTLIYFGCFIASVDRLKKNVKFNFDLGENGDDEPDVG